jgi:hypothetical protein
MVSDSDVTLLYFKETFLVQHEVKTEQYSQRGSYGKADFSITSSSS